MGVALLWRLSLVAPVLAAGHLALHYVKKLPETSSGPEKPEAVPGYGLHHQPVTVRSTDGLALDAWWVPGGSPRTAILVHAWGEDKRRPYVDATARVYNQAGFNVLALDLRAQGDSEGHRPTAGYQEVHDVRGALRWLEDRSIEPENTVLHGWSTGAATVIRAAPGTGVGAVVEEAGYADMPLLLCNMIPGGRGPSSLLAHLAFQVSKLFDVDFDPWALRPEKEATRLYKEHVPLFIIHSPDDRVVPFQHARLLAAAHPTASFWKVEGRGHIAAYTHPDYQRRLLEFLEPVAPARHEGPPFPENGCDSRADKTG